MKTLYGIFLLIKIIKCLLKKKSYTPLESSIKMSYRQIKYFMKAEYTAILLSDSVL